MYVHVIKIYLTKRILEKKSFKLDRILCAGSVPPAGPCPPGPSGCTAQPALPRSGQNLRKLFAVHSLHK